MQHLKKTVRWLIIRDNAWLAIGSYLLLVLIWSMIFTSPRVGLINDPALCSNDVSILSPVLHFILLHLISSVAAAVVWLFLFIGGFPLFSYWTKDWPENYIMQAHELLKTNPELANVLTHLIEECERTGNRVNLKEWLNDYRELASVRRELEMVNRELNKEKEWRERLVELQTKAQELAAKLGLPV